MSKEEFGVMPFGEKGMIRQNYDYGEGLYFGIPSEKFFKKLKKKKNKKAHDDILYLAEMFLKISQ
jgi:hypothetical protein